jgi:hypothetical protein
MNASRDAVFSAICQQVILVYMYDPHSGDTLVDTQTLVYWRFVPLTSDRIFIQCTISTYMYLHIKH